MALTRIKSSNIEDETVIAADLADGSITDAKIQTGISSSKLTGNLPAVSGAALTNLTSANLTGALPAISGANLSGVSTDTSAMENNIAILAFKTQSANNLAKFNLVDQVIDEYKDDTGLGTQTDVDRTGSTAADGYISSVGSATVVNTWTVEFNIRIPDTSGAAAGTMLFDIRDNANVKRVILYTASGNLYFVVNGVSGSLTTLSNYLADDTWGWMAMTRDSSRNIRFYLGSGTSSAANRCVLSNVTEVPGDLNGMKVMFGAYNANGTPTGYWFKGQMDEIRISKTARYTGTGNAAYPSHPFVSDSDTLLLLNAETAGGGSFADKSSFNRTVTNPNNWVTVGSSALAHTGTYGYNFDTSNNEYLIVNNYDDLEFTDTRVDSIVSATGTLISTANTALSAPTTGDICMLIENAAGTATLNTDLKAYISRNGGTGWDQVTLADKGSWGTNKKILTANNVAFSNSASGTDMRYKIEWANQASGSKETRVHATSLAWA